MMEKRTCFCVLVRRNRFACHADAQGKPLADKGCYSQKQVRPLRQAPAREAGIQTARLEVSAMKVVSPVTDDSSRGLGIHAAADQPFAETGTHRFERDAEE